MKFCRKCQTEKPKSAFYRRRDTACGLMSHCKRCMAEDQRTRNRKMSGICVDCGSDTYSAYSANQVCRPCYQRRAVRKRIDRAYWLFAFGIHYRNIGGVYSYMPSGMVRGILSRGSLIRGDEFPQELIDAKRLHLLINREIKR